LIILPFVILYEDDLVVVINKPPGILVHRTRLSEDKVFVLQLLRDQLGGMHLYPAHRLDRATSGVLVFAKDPVTAGWLGERLMSKEWEKKYLAVVRGFIKEKEGIIDYALTDPETGKHEPQSAITRYRTLQESEMPWPIGLRYPTARFSLMEMIPETGRRQQIRKHLGHIRHPIVNDTQHGDIKINKWFKINQLPDRIMLHALELTLPHPQLEKPLCLRAPLDECFKAVLQMITMEIPEDPQDKIIR
jgi:tRNA pseudouridine65 synthase